MKLARSFPATLFFGAVALAGAALATGCAHRAEVANATPGASSSGSAVVSAPTPPQPDLVQEGSLEGVSLAAAAVAQSNASVRDADCPPAGMTPAPPEFPTAPPHPSNSGPNQVAQRYLDYRYGSFGDTQFLKPRTQENELKNPPVGPLTPNGLFQNYDTHKIRGGYQGQPSPGTPGNIFVSANLNAAFKDDMWQPGQQLTDFAQRVVHMLGFQSFAMSSLESGPGLTRAPAGSPYRGGYDKKYIIGTINQAVPVRGMSSVDDVAAIGAVNMGSTAFANSPDDLDPDTSLTIDQRRRLYYGGIQGSENDAWIGRAITPTTPPVGNENDKVGQEIGYHEDDYWDPRPASVYRLAGSGHFVWFDNKKIAENSAIATTAPFNAGYVARAVAVETGLLAFVEGSWVNVDQARGFSTFLGGGTGAFPTSPNYFTPDERCGSVIRDWAGIEIMAPFVDPEIEVRSAAGIIVADQDPEGDGGDPPLNAAVFSAAAADGSMAKRAPSAPEPFSVETRASAIFRGPVVVGDASANAERTGWDVDVLHVNGAIRLAALSEPPALGSRVPDAEAAGLLYFDLKRNCLRVSTPLVINEGTRAQQSVLIWRDLPFGALQSGDAARHAVRPVADGAVQARRASLDERSLQAGHEGAKRVAERGVSPYAQPRMEIMPAAAGAKRMGPEPVTLLFNALPREHFDPSGFRLAWRRLAGGQAGGRYRQGEVPWTPIDPKLFRVEFVNASLPGDAQRTVVPQVTLKGIDFAGPAPDGFRGDGMLVQLMAVTATGSTTGASFRLDH